jgi:hypothetical protein
MRFLATQPLCLRIHKIRFSANDAPFARTRKSASRLPMDRNGIIITLGASVVGVVLVVIGNHP